MKRRRLSRVLLARRQILNDRFKPARMKVLAHRSAVKTVIPDGKTRARRRMLAATLASSLLDECLLS